MDTTKKPWVYKRKNIKGWWCGWYEGGKRKTKALPTKALAEHFRHIKYTQLNSDVFTSVVDFDWRHLVQEYVQFKQVEGCKDASIYEIRLTLRRFERLVGCNSSKGITQPNLDAFVLKRSEEVDKGTLNKDITNLRAFFKWAVRNRFVASGLDLRKVKVPQKAVVALSVEQVRDLLTTAATYPTLRLRVLPAVTTGLRRGDIHFDRNTISTRNRKAGKAMPERPVPEAIMTELANHVAGLSEGQETLFCDRFSPKKWGRTREKVKIPDPIFQVLRKIFASLLAQRGASTAVTQRGDSLLLFSPR
jgi:integrase